MRSLSASGLQSSSLPSPPAAAYPPTATLSGRLSGACPLTQALPTTSVPLPVAAFMMGGAVMSAGLTPRPLKTMYGNDAIWVDLGSSDGRIVGVADPGGRLGAIFGTYRLFAGALTVSAERLDGPSGDVVVSVPDGYGSAGFQVVGIDFPSAGCWRITERVAGWQLQFVVSVARGS